MPEASRREQQQRVAERRLRGRLPATLDEPRFLWALQGPTSCGSAESSLHALAQRLAGSPVPHKLAVACMRCAGDTGSAEAVAIAASVAVAASAADNTREQTSERTSRLAELLERALDVVPARCAAGPLSPLAALPPVS